MPILVCRVAWMSIYQSDNEPAVGGGRWIDEGNLPHESLNFPFLSARPTMASWRTAGIVSVLISSVHSRERTLSMASSCSFVPLIRKPASSW